MKRFFSKKNIITLIILLIIGLALAFLARRGQDVAWQVMAADVLFSQASIVLLWGAVLLLGNMHMFTSFTYSFRQLHRLMRGNQMKGTEMKEDYLHYRNTRTHHDDTSFYFIVGAVMLAAALLVGMIA